MSALRACLRLTAQRESKEDVISLNYQVQHVVSDGVGMDHVHRMLILLYMCIAWFQCGQLVHHHHGNGEIKLANALVPFFFLFFFFFFPFPKLINEEF